MKWVKEIHKKSYSNRKINNSSNYCITIIKDLVENEYKKYEKEEKCGSGISVK